MSFDKGFFLTIRAIQLLKKHANAGEPIVVGIAGPSGAGKTVFCQKIQDFMPGLCVLSMDMYNDASMLLDGNFDDPRLTDYDLLMENLSDLKAGKTVETPVYSFKESKRVGTKTVACPESRIIIVEGIYALSDKLRPLQDLRVSISGGVHFDLVKRVMRDIDRSGQAPEDIIHQISETVYPMYKAFIEPDLRSAHLRVVNSFNPFAGFQDPTYILKSETVVDPAAIASVLAEDGVVETSECETTDIYLLPPHEDPETCTSWLRMRNRDGLYTLMFEETMCDGDVMISPRIKFEVGVRILGGLMALGYEVGAIMKRRSREWSDELLSVKVDWIEGLDRSFTQIQGKVRAAVVEAGSKLGLDGTYIPHSYIEQVQFEEMTEELRHMTAEMKDTFVLAARAPGVYPPDPIERTASGGYMTAAPRHLDGHSSVMNSAQKASKGARARRGESVTRLQDAVRGRGRGGGGAGRGGRPGSRNGSFGGDGDAFGGDGEDGSFSRGGSPPAPGPGHARSPRALARDGAPGGAFARGRPPVSPRAETLHARVDGPSAAERATFDRDKFDRDADRLGAPEAYSAPGLGAFGANGFANGFGSRSHSPAPGAFASGEFAAGLEVGGVNRLEGRINLLAQRVEDLAARVARGAEASEGSRLGSPTGEERARMRAALRDREWDALGTNTAGLLLAASAGAMLAGCVAAAFAYGRGGR